MDSRSHPMQKSEEPPRPKLSEKLDSLIRQQGTSQLAVAREAGMPQTTLSNWITRGVLDEDVQRLVRIAAVLGVTINELVGAPVPQNPPISGMFLVDLDTVDLIRSGKRIGKGQAWYAVVPERHLLCTPQQYAEIDRTLPERWRRKKE